MHKTFVIAVLLLAGCGSGTSEPGFLGPTVTTSDPLPVGGAGGAEEPDGRLYAVTDSRELNVFRGVNRHFPRGFPRGTGYPNPAVPLPLLPRCISYDPARDRLYIGGDDEKGGVLVVFTDAARLTATSTPAILVHLGQIPLSSTYDESRDILYLAGHEERLGRLADAAGVTNTTVVPFQALNPLTTITGIAIDERDDQLLVGGATAGGKPQSVFTFAPASSNPVLQQSTVLSGMRGLGNKLELADFDRLLALEDTPEVSRVLRYDTANDYGDPPTLSSRGGSAFEYARLTDILFTSTPFIDAYLNVSRITGPLTEEHASSIHYVPSGSVADMVCDPTH